MKRLLHSYSEGVCIQKQKRYSPVIRCLGSGTVMFHIKETGFLLLKPGLHQVNCLTDSFVFRPG